MSVGGVLFVPPGTDTTGVTADDIVDDAAVDVPSPCDCVQCRCMR
ncbi:MAG: hypothetical protein Q8O67_08230 [Deltaproteobacteria bacterium]|nr:hypothetical protein [Deltaproteobacteria bacterium]